VNSSIAIGLDWTVSSYVIDHKWNYVMSGNLLRIYLLARAPQSDCVSTQYTSERFTYYRVTHDGAAKEKDSLGYVALGSDLR